MYAGGWSEDVHHGKRRILISIRNAVYLLNFTM